MLDIVILAAIVGAVLLRYGFFGDRWREMFRRAIRPALVLGGIGFVGGFVGPIIFAPGANQGPLLGIFITGPGGFVVGLIYGVLREVFGRKPAVADSPGG